MNFFKSKKRRRTLDTIEFGTVLGEGLNYRGDVTGDGNYWIKGHVRGNCNIAGDLLLAPTAQWNGDVAASRVVIAGEVTGDVYASVKLELKPTAHVHGDVMSPFIAMAEGARYDGSIRSRLQSELLRFNEKRSQSN
jgi:cytoskeletal protein CcmA (bactofilin family)